MVTSLETDSRISYLKRYGNHLLAYASLQDGLDFYLEAPVGYIAFRSTDRLLSRPLVFGDPICDSHFKNKLLESFIIKHPNPIFLQVSRHTAEVLSTRGFLINEFGVETFINVQDYDLLGPHKAHLRRAVHCAERDGIKIEELADSPSIREQARKISEVWLGNKAVNFGELRFLLRPPVYEAEMDVRKFYALEDNKIIGFVFFDPIYANGRVISYLANIERCLHDRSSSVIDCIIIHALNVFKQEGLTELSLALSPLASISDSGDLPYGKGLKQCLSLCYKHGGFLYRFQENASHKRRYRPDLPGAREEKVYFAFQGAFSIRTTYEVFSVIGFRPIKQLLNYVNRLTSKIAQPI